MKYSSLFILILLPALAFAAAGQETRDLEMSAAEIDTLRIQCGAGHLILRGNERLKKIEVDADILVEGLDAENIRSFLENNLLLDLQKRGNRAVLRAEFLRSSRFKPTEAKVDLLVRVPRKMNVSIDDGSGPIHASGFYGDFEIDDGSGSITIRGITGSVRVGDASGPMKMEVIRGNVDVKDGPGSIDVKLVIGDVSVVDATGSITIQDIEGHVKVSDGSGSIDIHDISKSVSILESDSGEISIEGVQGKIIRRDKNAPDEEIETVDEAE